MKKILRRTRPQVLLARQEIKQESVVARQRFPDVITSVLRVVAAGVILENQRKRHSVVQQTAAHDFLGGLWRTHV